jgi:DNA-binding transcriptional MerR regulator
VTDSLLTLREYRQLAPWSLKDLARLSAAILETSGVRPVNAAAKTLPNERTIRFYVNRGLVSPPEGKGNAAVYSYRHLLQVLAIKLRQMEGATLATIAEELKAMTGDVLERRVAASLGTTLPPPVELPLTPEDIPARGRAARALRTFLARGTTQEEPPESRSTTWQRIPVSRGVELHIQQEHPLLRRGIDHEEIAAAIRLSVTRLLAEREPESETLDPTPVPQPH